MAIIDKKKLLKNFNYRKLTPSARLLLDALAKCTNQDGIGSPSWGGLMYFSGIVGKDTFIKCRQQLEEMGLITWKKEWSSIVLNGKKLPHPKLIYEITKTILLEKWPLNQDKSPKNSNFRSMDMESMDSRKEGVNTLGVNNIDVNNYQPSAGSKQIKKEKKEIYPYPLDEGVSKGLVNSAIVTRAEEIRNSQQYGEAGAFPDLILESTDWREAALLIAAYIKFNPEGDKEWFGFFKKVYKKGQQNYLNEALYYTESAIDDIDIKDIRKIFFSNFYSTAGGYS